MYRLMYRNGENSIWMPYTGMLRRGDTTYVKTIEFKNVPDSPQVSKFYKKYGRQLCHVGL